MIVSSPRRELSRPLKIYICTVASAGATVLALSAAALPATPRLVECVLFAGLAMVAGSFTIKVAGVPATISVADTFFLTIALLFGPAPATVSVAIDSSLMSWRKRHSADRLIFNATAPALSLWVASHVFFALAQTPRFAQTESPVTSVPVPLLCFTAVYFLLNSSLTAIAVGLDTRQSPLDVWHHHFRWLSVSYMAAGSAAFCLLLLVHQLGIGAVAMMLPVLAVFHLTLRSSFGRLEDARRHLGDMDRLYLSTVETLAMAIDAKDDVTHSHVRRVQTYAVGLAKALGVADELTIKAIEAAALLHDTGKLAVPEHILNKPGKLTEAEFETMKRHVDVGADILSLVDFPYPVVPIVRCHHENWDGSGYPRGVKGEDIPIGARILSVVDCFDALTSDRPYRSAMTTEAAFEILRARSGTMYDPRVIEMFMAIQKSIAPEGAEHEQPHHQVLQQISRSSVATARPDPPPAIVAASASDDVLAFVSLSRMASGEHSTGDVFALASSLLRDLAQGSTVAWYLRDPARDALVVAHASGPAAGLLRGLSVPIGGRLTGWVAANRRPIVNSDAALDLGAGSPLQSCLSAPLISGDALVGVVTIYAEQPQAFTDDDGRLLQMVLPHVAQILARARRENPADAAPEKPPNRDLRLVATR